MKFFIDEVPIYFPFDYIYPEQYKYMMAIKRCLDNPGTGVFEMPSGTGKTVCLLCVGMGYQEAHPDRAKKIIYCSRTVVEIEKVLNEARVVYDYKSRMKKAENPPSNDHQEQSLENNLNTVPNSTILSKNNTNNNNNNNNANNSKSNNNAISNNNTKTNNNQTNTKTSDVSQDELSSSDQLDYLCIGLASRKNLCINESVNRQKESISVDSLCRDLTSSFVREKAKKNSEIPLCSLYENLANVDHEISLKGVFSLEQLRKFGHEQSWCPYFLARKFLEQADMIVFSYQYLLDPKISDMVSKDFAAESVVFFDEAHNIDNVCCDALSIHLSRRTVDRAVDNIKVLDQQIREKKKEDMDRITNEYNRLLNNLATNIPSSVTDTLRSQPVLSRDQIKEVVPGNIRKGEHFLMFLLRFIEWIKAKLKTPAAVSEIILALRHDVYQEYQIEPKVLQFCSSRLASLFWTLKISEIQEFSSLYAIADFATLLGTYSKGFLVLIEPNSDSGRAVLQMSCLDASLAIQPLFEKYRSVIMTSGTISPLDMYPKLLNFRPIAVERFSMTTVRNNVCPAIITRGSDQVAITSKFDARSDPAVVRNFGNLLTEVCTIVPDGVICFFPSYTYMEQIIWMWNEQDLLNGILANKLLFIETPDSSETALALDLFRQACNSGRGAVFFCVSRGKVSEGIDFNDHYGRAVIVFGVPYLNTQNRILKARLEYMRDYYQVKEGDFLNFDAMRVTSQCLGRVIRSKLDYGIMILADRRFNRTDKREKLPKWIHEFLLSSNLNLSTDMALNVMKSFLRDLAQPISKMAQLQKKTLWELKDLQEYQKTNF